MESSHAASRDAEPARTPYLITEFLFPLIGWNFELNKIEHFGLSSYLFILMEESKRELSLQCIKVRIYISVQMQNLFATLIRALPFRGSRF